MITQRDAILQEVVSVFRRRLKVIKNVKIRNNRVIRKKKGRRSTNRDQNDRLNYFTRFLNFSLDILSQRMQKFSEI